MRLIHVSKVSIIESKKKKNGIDPISAIYEIIRRLAEQITASSESTRNPVMKMSDILPRVIAKGYTQQQLDSCLQDYSNLNVWQYSENKNELYFL
jgi:DNA replication licensing factor MCM7